MVTREMNPSQIKTNDQGSALMILEIKELHNGRQSTPSIEKDEAKKEVVDWCDDKSFNCPFLRPETALFTAHPLFFHASCSSSSLSSSVSDEDDKSSAWVMSMVEATFM